MRAPRARILLASSSWSKSRNTTNGLRAHTVQNRLGADDHRGGGFLRRRGGVPPRFGTASPSGRGHGGRPGSRRHLGDFETG